MSEPERLPDRSAPTAEPPEAAPARTVPDPGKVDAAATRIRLALAELEDAGPGGSSGTEAAELLSAIEEARQAEGDDEVRRRCWGAVAHARAEVKRLAASRPTEPPLLPSVVARVRELHDITQDLEARAHRKLAAAGAFRRLVEARRAEQAAIEAAGFATFAELEAAAGADREEELAARQSAAATALEEAEAAWNELERRERRDFPSGEVAEILRARGYRLVGAVVDDRTLVAMLQELASEEQRRTAAETLLASALRDLGFEPAGDARTIAEAWLAAVATGPRRA